MNRDPINVSKNIDISCLGIILVDMFPTNVGIPLADVSSFSPKPGGAPANVAVAAQRLGSSTAFHGKVGQDIFGHWLKGILIKEGVNTDGMSFDEEARTTMVFIGMPNKQQAEFVFYRNPGADMRLRVSDLNQHLLRQSKALHVDSLSLTHPEYRQATLKAINIVKESNGWISYDVNYRPTMWPSPEEAIQAAIDILPLCDIIKVNEDELALITGETDPMKGGRFLLEAGTDLCLITLGEKGAYYLTHNLEGYMPAFKVKTIDAIGCGDAFLGAILHQLTAFDSYQTGLSSENLESVIRFATAAGALTSTKRGALPALPCKSDVDTFLLSNQHFSEAM